MTAKIDGTNGLIQQYVTYVPTTGFSYTFPAGTTTLVMIPAGALASGTITMPAAPADGMTITISSSRSITSLTVSANTGQSITNTPTSIGAGASLTFVYQLSNTTWYPISPFPTGTITNPTLSSPTISGTPTGVGVLTPGTAVASTSGTAIDFTSIPSWVNRITVMLNGVSTSGTSIPQIQLGTGAGPTYTTSGYLGASSDISASVGTVQHSVGFALQASGAATTVMQGVVTINNITGNTWVAFGVIGRSSNANTSTVGGAIPLAAALTAVRITTANGTDTFDAGSINILYE